MSTKKPPLENVSMNVPTRPNTIVLHAVEGWGKTSFAAQFPAPVFLMSKGETGLLTLMGAGQLPPVAHFQEAQGWEDLMFDLRALATTEHNYKTVVLDTGNGFERQCHEMVCDRDYNGDWGDKGFASYYVGYGVALADWRRLLFAGLDYLRERIGMTVVLLCHTTLKSQKNPEGPDWDRWRAAMHAKTWDVTAGWADMVLFGNYVTTVLTDKQGRNPKAQGGTRRVLYTQRTATWDAKNRHGLPEQLECGDSPAAAYAAFLAALNHKGEATSTTTEEGS